jgi:alpha-mannosidase
MNKYDKMNIIKENAKSYYSQRIASQLVYALKLSQTENNIFDKMIEDAIGYLYNEIEQVGCITNEAAINCENMLLPLREKAKQYQFYCVSHAHIDMNWMWSFNETVSITLDTFRTILKLMEEYPQFTFSQSQASTYKIAEEYDSQMFEQIKKMVSLGRWEVTASTWVETDKNMPSGESLARHILYTKKYFKEKFNINSEDLQLDFEPDTFGHNISVPEILSKGKVKYYYHCRGYDQHFIYNWKSPSGESILVYREPTWYNASITPDIIEYVPEFCKKHDINFMLKVYGVGDHGGGPTRRDIEALIDMSEWPIAPTIEFSTYHQFFNALEKHRDQFPVVDHELNYVFTGCYSSQSRIKWANRIAEDSLFTAEAATALAFNFVNGDNYTGKYKKAWEMVLFNQFHDIITGSGVRETREHAMGKIQDAIGYTYTGMTKAITDIAKEIDTSSIITPFDKTSISEGGGVGYKGSNCFNSSNIGGLTVIPAERGNGKTRILHIFNHTAFDREETIEVTIWDYSGKIEQLAITDIKGDQVPFKHCEHNDFWGHKFDKINLFAKVNSFGFNTYILNEAPKIGYSIALQFEPIIEVYSRNILENEYVKAEFDDNNMMLMSLTDKKTGKKLIKEESAYFKYIEQSHKSHTVMPGNAWVEGYETKVINLNKTEQVYVTERSDHNPLRQHIKYSIPFKKSKMNVTVFLDKDSTVLKYKIECDWQEVFSLEFGIPALKFVVPLSYNTKNYKYEIPFGTIIREDQNHDVPARGFAYGINADDHLGIAVFTDSIYAYRGVKNTISITLLRASQEPDPYPEYGLHNVNIGISICENDHMQLYRKSSDFIYPLTYLANTSHGGSLSMEHSFIKTSGNIIVSAVKSPEQLDKGIVIRLFDGSGQGTDGTVIFDRSIKGAEVVNIIEEPCGKTLTIIENKIHIRLKSYETITLKVVF